MNLGVSNLLHIISASSMLDYGQMVNVYHESLLREGREKYPNLDQNLQQLEVEQDFYLFLKSFLKQSNSFCAVWALDCGYVSALRIEPYRDGFLVEGLETHPNFRNHGYAKQLLRATLDYLNDRGRYKIYSHIHPQNISSVKVHLSCGFICVSDCAAYVDGSVDNHSCTYLYCVQ